MQKKLVFGFAAAALAGSLFIACGDGDVSSTSADDESSAFLNDPDYYKTLIESATTACNDDPKCAANIGNIVVEPSSSSASEITEPSSASVSSASMSSASVLPPLLSSSSPIVNLSSASVITSSASVIVSSSSVEIEDNGTVNGTCDPVPAKIEKGASTKWTFKRVTPSGMAGMTAQQNALFDWTMPNSTEGTFSELGKNGGNAATATYTASGSFGATLQVDGNTIQCSALQVNGAPITGCVCTPDVANPDVASGSATVTWTVSDCQTTGATITGYAWTDATGTGETATASFTEKGQEITPVVTVSNDDNTQEQFTCASAKAVNSSTPDYELTAKNEELPIPSGACAKVQIAGTVTVKHGWQNDSCTVKLSINGGASNSDTIPNCNCGWKEATKLSTSVSVSDEVCIEYTTSDNAMSLMIID